MKTIKLTVWIMVLGMVLGCDGVTYSNACSASAAGVKCMVPGECGKKK